MQVNESLEAGYLILISFHVACSEEEGAYIAVMWEKTFGGILPEGEGNRQWRLSTAYLTRVVTFLAYAGMALLLWIQSMGKSSCYVQITYKQEFLAKVVSNPFYSSSQIVKQGPPSMYEVDKQFSAPYRQQASDLGIFPIISSNPLLHSAFWPVEAVPKEQLVAGGAVNLPGRDMRDGIYYFDEEAKKLFAKGVPSQGGTGPILASVALQAVNGPVKVGVPCRVFALYRPCKKSVQVG